MTIMTRFAAIVGLMALLGIRLYHAVMYSIVRWDILGVVAAIALAKVSAMLYYARVE